MAADQDRPTRPTLYCQCPSGHRWGGFAHTLNLCPECGHEAANAYMIPFLDRVRATKSDNGVLIRMSHENARKLAELVGELPADGISVDIWDALNELGYGNG